MWQIRERSNVDLTTHDTIYLTELRKIMFKSVSGITMPSDAMPTARFLKDLFRVYEFPMSIRGYRTIISISHREFRYGNEKIIIELFSFPDASHCVELENPANYTMLDIFSGMSFHIFVKDSMPDIDI